MPTSNEDKGKPSRRDARPLVSEARPIPWEQLSEAEQELVTNKADPWIKAVIEDSKRYKPATDEIDERRTGRVLFIDGPRGAGKTSFLLTLLKRWTAQPNQTSDYGDAHCSSNLRVFLPVLDFDPLPRGMPLHGWLLEPWRKHAREPEPGSKPGADAARLGSGDLSELFADLFERAVIGWTPAHTEGKGVVDKALAYQERASGWLETTETWNKFVGAMACRESGCSGERCKRSHRFVFVIAIDDVDLQVEHLPQLLHAIRLLHHPNVAYVLTGNYEHLRFALLLDYLRRHEQQAGTHNKNIPWDEINIHSNRLRDALLEKALPRHARLELEHLCLKDVLRIRPDGTREISKIVNETLKSLPEAARALKVVTARKAQHAMDRLLESRTIAIEKGNAPERNISHILEFVANLCDTSITKSTNTPPTWQFAQRGRLTTRLGNVFRAWEGRDRLTILLAERPRFVFLPDFNQEDIRIDEQAHGALLVQLLIEKKNTPARALALNWAPDELILATEVRWQPKSGNIEGLAVFHWPVLVRPTASQVLDLHKLAKAISNQVNGDSQIDVTEKMVTLWLSKNIEWQYAIGNNTGSTNQQKEWTESQKRWTDHPNHSFNSVAVELENISKRNNDLKQETARWVNELVVMTAPYFGLPEQLAQEMRRRFFSINGIVPSGEELKKEQDRTIRNAIIAPRTLVAQLRRKPLDEKTDLTSSDLDDAVKGFLEVRKSAARDDWWQWLDRRASSGTARKPRPRGRINSGGT
ncbi:MULTISPECIES: hypothetical protein [Sorangium]|uniref:hypothetical protein n=1 Tax=Sorangium TaxID=39643 RepID=UPI003D9C29EC